MMVGGKVAAATLLHTTGCHDVNVCCCLLIGFRLLFGFGVVMRCTLAIASSQHIVVMSPLKIYAALFGRQYNFCLRKMH